MKNKAWIPFAIFIVLVAFFANGQAEARAVGFAVCGEGLKQTLGNLRGDARAGVRQLGDDFPIGLGEAQRERTFPGHGFCGVVR